MSQKEKVKFVYKYETINEHLFENLEKNQLYFEDPRRYNDPFDSKINGFIEYTEKQWFEKFYQDNPNATQMYAQMSLRYLINEGKLKQDPSTRIITEDIENKQPPLTCCFSDTKNNILMWSHYANKHKGVCLSYKTIQTPVQTEETKNFTHSPSFSLTVNLEPIPLWEVKYHNKKPEYRNFAEVITYSEVEPFFDNLLTKSTCWKYENERRLISLDNKNIHEFKKEELEGIVLGVNVKHYDAYKVYKIIEKYYINKDIPINFYKATKNQNYYKLNINKIKEDKVEEYIESLT